MKMVEQISDPNTAPTGMTLNTVKSVYSDAELDAATEAYVGLRWAGVKEWRERWPEAWRDTRAKMQAALMAAAKVRANGNPES